MKYSNDHLKSITLLIMLLITVIASSQTVSDVTIETYGIFGKGRPGNPGDYYFLQIEGDGTAKIKPVALVKSTINVEKEGQFIYFRINDTDKYLKFTGKDNLVKWVDGKDENSAWREVAPVQPGAGAGWKSYVSSTNSNLYLRHYQYIMYADPSNHPRSANKVVFNGDATWRILGGMLVPPVGTPYSNAYGRKLVQTYSVVNKATNSYCIGIASNNQIKIVDINNPSSGKAITLEIRYKSSKNCAIILEMESGRYLTTGVSGNILLTDNEEAGSYWEITDPKLSGLGPGWFSMRSLHPSLDNCYLRHTNYILYAHRPGTVNAEYFNGDASWKFVAKN